MMQTVVRDLLFPECPIRNVLSRIGDKWSMLVLYTLRDGDVKRFNELKRELPDISTKMLSSTLKILEADGLVSRKLYAEVPPRVEYALTSRGLSLIPVLNELLSWAMTHFAEIMQDRESTSRDIVSEVL